MKKKPNLGQGKGTIVFTVLSIIGVFAFMMHLFTNVVAPPESNSFVTSAQLARARAPKEARKVANPVALSREVVEEGDALYHEKGGCNVCHGDGGKGDGQGGVLLSPPPRDLTDANFHRLRTDGEMFWVIKNGISGTGMFSYSPRMITEEEVWKVIHYIRTIKDSSSS